MRTEQNYDPGNGSATTVDPTVTPNTAATSTDSTATTPESTASADTISAPLIECPTLRLSYVRYGQRDSSAFVLYNALTMYRNDRIKWLFQYAKEDNVGGSLPLFAEVEILDEALDTIVRGFEANGTNLLEQIESDTFANKETNQVEYQKALEIRLKAFMTR